jgi:phosphoesterase RecJ-like protein
VVCPDPAPTSLDFLPGSADIVTTHIPSADLTVIVDCSDLQRLDHLYTPDALAGRTIIEIDHHATNLYYADLNVVDPARAAVGELIYDLLRVLEAPIDQRVAICLLTAIVTDSLGFRTSTTTSRTLRTAAELMDAGAPLAQIAEMTLEHRPLPVMRLWGEVLSSFKTDHGVILTAISQDMLRRHRVSEDEVKGLVNILRSIQGTKVAILLVESADGRVKVEFRSNGQVNVAEIAVSLGGGGHRPAAGCTLPGPLSVAEQRVMDEVQRYLSTL